MIRFVDIRNQGIGSRFAFWDTIESCFLKIGGDFAWDNWKDFILFTSNDLNPEQYERFKSLCPEWAFDNEEDALEDWCAGEIVSPYEKIQELETKIETMKRDNVLEQLDCDMKKEN